MRKFIDIINEGLSPNHYRIEIIFSESAELLLDSFKNPANELTINYRVVYDDIGSSGKLYMDAIVVELQNNKPVIKVDYVLGSTELVISNVVSFREDKNMVTSSGIQQGAADMGYAAMKWLYKNILTDAENRGFNCTKITSSTRYSGARAKNGEQTQTLDLPVNYNVKQKIKERFIYILKNGIVFL
jgi:hypothetical protein